MLSVATWIDRSAIAAAIVVVASTGAALVADRMVAILVLVCHDDASSLWGDCGPVICMPVRM